MNKLLIIWLFLGLSLQAQKIEEVSLPPETEEEAMYLFLEWKNEHLAQASEHLNYEDALTNYAKNNDTLALVLLVESDRNKDLSDLYKQVKGSDLIQNQFISNLILESFFKQERYPLAEEQLALMEKKKVEINLKNLYHLRSFYIQFEKDEALEGVLWLIWNKTEFSEPIFEDLVIAYQKRSALYELLEGLEIYPQSIQWYFQELLLWKSQDWEALAVFWDKHECQNEDLKMAYNIKNGKILRFDRNWYYFTLSKQKKEAKLLWLWAKYCQKETLYCTVVPDLFKVGVCTTNEKTDLEAMALEDLYLYLKEQLVLESSVAKEDLLFLKELYPLNVKAQAILYALDLINEEAWFEVSIYAIDEEDEALVKYFQDGSSEKQFLVLDLCKFWKEKNKEAIRKQLEKY